MRRPRPPIEPRAPLATASAALRVPSAIASVALAVALAGCGAPNEAGGARERDEPRAYGRVVVRSELTPRRVTLGDPVVWTVTATVPRASTPMALRVEPAPASLEIVPRGEASTRPARDGYVWSRRYDLRGFDLGLIALPSAVLDLRVRDEHGVAFADSLVFPPDTLTVDSLTASASGALSPDRGPLDPGLRAVDFMVAAAIALLVIGLVVMLIVSLRRRRARPVAAIPSEPPEAVFGRALEALRAEGATLPRGAFHDRLSGAVRRYVTEATGVDAIDRTTRELERELNRSGRSHPEAAAEIVRILRRSDLVKFAKRADAWDEAKALLDDAARLAGAVAAPTPREEP